MSKVQLGAKHIEFISSNIDEFLAELCEHTRTLVKTLRKDLRKKHREDQLPDVLAEAAMEIVDNIVGSLNDKEKADLFNHLKQVQQVKSKKLADKMDSHPLDFVLSIRSCFKTRMTAGFPVRPATDRSR